MNVLNPIRKLTKLLSFITLSAILTGCASTYIDQRARSPHFKDGRFVNDTEPDRERSLWGFLKMRYITDWAEWPDSVESAYGPKPAASVPGPEIHITHINHSTVLIQTGGYNILTDPIYSDSCSPVPFFNLDRVRKPGIRFEDLPRIDVVIISHDHYDHLDLPTVNRLVERDHPLIFLGLGVGKRLDSMERVKELDWWESVKIAADFSLTFVPAQHFSGRTLFDRFSTLWGSFVLEIGSKKIYFSGDSGYAGHYKEAYERFGPMDVALLPIGHYAPRDFMGFAHLDPKQAVQAHLDLHARKSIGIHHSTFPLTAETIDEPITLLARARAEAGLREDEFIATAFGQPVVISNKPGP